MSNIRSVILSNCHEKWLKVARVVWRVHMELSLPDDDDGYALVENELKHMVDDGILEVVGDLSNWRQSEVRRINL